MVGILRMSQEKKSEVLIMSISKMKMVKRSQRLISMLSGSETKNMTITI